MIKNPNNRCSHRVGIFFAKKPARIPPAQLPIKYGIACSQGTVPRWYVIDREIRHMGSIIITEEGKISFSSSFVNLVRSGTKTMPPPAPNSPLTAPAPAPANPLPRYFLSFKPNTSCGNFLHRRMLYTIFICRCLVEIETCNLEIYIV